MRFIEETEAQWSAEQLAAAERQIEDQKREWEENRLAALRQEEERRSRQAEEDSEMLTFSREDATNQVGIRRNSNNKNRRSGNFVRRGRRSNNRRFNKRDSVRIVPGKRKRGARNCTTNSNSLPPRRKSPVTRKSVENRDKKENNDKEQSGEDDTVVSNISNISNTNSNECNSSKKDEVLSDNECTLSALDETPVSDSPKTPTSLVTKYTSPSPPKTTSKIIDLSDEEETSSPVSTTKPSPTTTSITKKGKNNKSILNSTPIANKNDKTENSVSSSDDDEEEEESSSDDETLNNHISGSKPDKQSSSSSETSDDEDSNSSYSSTNSSDSSNDHTEISPKRTRLVTNKLDHNSPRTRSRGTVKINLWTLDVSPILPGVKPVRSGTPLPKHRSRIFKFRSAKSVDKCNNKNSTLESNKLDKLETNSIIEECISSKVSVVMTDVLTSNSTNLVQNNSVSSTSDSLITVADNPPFKKPKSPLKYRNNKLPADQKSLDDWLTKVPSSPNNSNITVNANSNNTHSKRPSTPFPGSRTRRSGTSKSDDSLEPPKKVKIVKSESSNGPVIT